MKGKTVQKAYSIHDGLATSSFSTKGECICSQNSELPFQMRHVTGSRQEEKGMSQDHHENCFHYQNEWIQSDTEKKLLNLNISEAPCPLQCGNSLQQQRSQPIPAF